jgi:hypothetical protein
VHQFLVCTKLIPYCKLILPHANLHAHLAVPAVPVFADPSPPTQVTQRYFTQDRNADTLYPHHAEREAAVLVVQLSFHLQLRVRSFEARMHDLQLGDQPAAGAGVPGDAALSQGRHGWCGL